MFKYFFVALFLTVTGMAMAQGTPDFARALSADLGFQGRVMWVDATANLERIKTLAGVQDIVAHCRQAGITTIVLDVKPVCGEVVYNSHIAPHLLQWQGKTYPEFDSLAAFVDECHKAGLQICASFNTLGEGHKYYKVGPGYINPGWQSITYTVDRTLVAPDGSALPIRAEDETDGQASTVVHASDFIQYSTSFPGTQLAVELDADHRVAGIIDPALLGDEPLTAPEDGRLLVLNDGALDWATKNLQTGQLTHFNAVGNLVPIADAPSEKVAVFVNPLNPAVKAYEMSLFREVAQNYNVDGIVFDRLRYANIYNDFSDITRSAFEKWLGKPVMHWPGDILQYDPTPGEPMERGPYFKPWLEFRARVMRTFLRDATQTVQSVKPQMKFGAYVGSWFTEYYGVGVNWGSEKFDVNTSWATPSYNEAGYAEYLSWLCTGCYYPIPTRADAIMQHKGEGGTVQAAAQLSEAAVANSVPVYAALYVLNYSKNLNVLSDAIQAATRNSQGVMIFDLSYIYDYNLWGLLQQAFAQPALSPDMLPELTAQLRKVQDAVGNPRTSHGVDIHLPPVPWQPGGG